MARDSFSNSYSAPVPHFARNLSLAFAAGAVGECCKLMGIWLIARAGVDALLNLSVQISPGLPGFLVRLAVGGIWGLLLLLPVLERSTLWRALLLSLLVTVWEGMITLVPGVNKVVIGLHFDARQVLTALLFNSLWAIAATLWYRLVR